MPDTQDIHKFANTICGEPPGRRPGASRVRGERFDNRSGATPLTGQGPWIESPCVSRCYASDLMDIHRLANKICGQLAIDCVAGVEDPAGMRPGHEARAQRLPAPCTGTLMRARSRA
ncbi:hypothetical protein F01_480031 [Burkholderia cenocepacia]|nr:hypothetical protein F01_480031 [Burkholderia cenocepacia]